MTEGLLGAYDSDDVRWLKLIALLESLESRLTEHQKLLDGRWFESIKALVLLDERLADLEKQVKRHYAWINELGDRLSENGG